MAVIRVEKTLKAPPEHVFELLSDHANYRRFRGIQRSELVREGDTERNGIGARRRLTSRPLTFVEEITVFERPTRLDYLILEVNVPLRHDGGTITIRPAGEDASDVLWISTFEITTPVIGRPAGRIAAAILARGFASMLRDVENAYRGG